MGEVGQPPHQIFRDLLVTDPPVFETFVCLELKCKICPACHLELPPALSASTHDDFDNHFGMRFQNFNSK